jgi:hypothetical protein
VTPWSTPCVGVRGRVHGQGDAVAEQVVADELDEAQVLVWLQHVALVVDEQQALAVGSNTRRAARRRPDQVATRCTAASRIEARAPAWRRTGSRPARRPASRSARRPCERRRAEAVVDDQLERRSAMRRVDDLGELGGVVLERAVREEMSPISSGSARR